jgi:hypothetical protein
MTTAVAEPPPTAQPRAAAKRRDWAPRIWMGCEFYGWVRLLVRNRFAVHWSLAYIALWDTFCSCINTVLTLLQEVGIGRQVARTPIRQAPIFIIGHWRTGTTLLHELLILDRRHSFPTTYQCLAPHHFLLTELVLPRVLFWVMPERRPMDNMATGWDRPQEDEFALCMLGVPSPYTTIAFPNHPPQDQDYLDLRRVPAPQRRYWKRQLYAFLQRLTYRDPRRLVLKSPPHTCRLRDLLDLFPDARFVHIVRDPYVVFPSTIHLWKALYRAHGLQKPRFDGLEEHVFRTFLHFYDRLEEGRRLVAGNRFHELRYEDLVRDPVGEIDRLYQRLELGGFDELRPRLEEFLAGQKNYETNRYELTPALRDEITRRWGPVIRKYGYSAQ